MTVLLLMCHLYFTFKTGFIQRYALKGIKYTFTPKKTESGIGTYAAFAAALGTTIGPGNITGVAVAISAGGAGAVFWMWLCGILAMPTKYAESFLAIRHKREYGGTMVLLDTLGNKKTAVIWAFTCAVGGLTMGAAVPSRSLSDVLPVSGAVTGTLLSVLVMLTVCFGVGCIANISSFLVPIMSVGFIAACIAVIVINIHALPHAVVQIIKGALSIRSVGAGAVGAAVKSGITRGLYSNESGLGSGGILAAESGDSDTVMSALASMTTVLWDTVIMCALTGVVFIINGAGRGCNAAYSVCNAFSGLPFGNIIMQASLALFVFATSIGWYYIAKRAVSFACENTLWYDMLYITASFAGALLPESILWSIADIINLIMLLPSLYVLIKMSGEIRNINLYIRNKG